MGKCLYLGILVITCLLYSPNPTEALCKAVYDKRKECFSGTRTVYLNLACQDNNNYRIVLKKAEYRRVAHGSSTCLPDTPSCLVKDLIPIYASQTGFYNGGCMAGTPTCRFSVKYNATNAYCGDGPHFVDFVWSCQEREQAIHDICATSSKTGSYISVSGVTRSTECYCRVSVPQETALVVRATRLHIEAASTQGCGQAVQVGDQSSGRVIHTLCKEREENQLCDDVPVFYFIRLKNVEPIAFMDFKVTLQVPEGRNIVVQCGQRQPLSTNPYATTPQYIPNGAAPTTRYNGQPYPSYPTTTSSYRWSPPPTQATWPPVPTPAPTYAPPPPTQAPPGPNPTISTVRPWRTEPTRVITYAPAPATPQTAPTISQSPTLSQQPTPQTFPPWVAPSATPEAAPGPPEVAPSPRVPQPTLSTSEKPILAFTPNPGNPNATVASGKANSGGNIGGLNNDTLYIIIAACGVGGFILLVAFIILACYVAKRNKRQARVKDSTTNTTPRPATPRSPTFAPPPASIPPPTKSTPKKVNAWEVYSRVNKKKLQKNINKEKDNKAKAKEITQVHNAKNKSPPKGSNDNVYKNDDDQVYKNDSDKSDGSISKPFIPSTYCSQLPTPQPIRHQPFETWNM